MAGKGVYVVLLGIIGILSLALAVLIIFIFTTFNSVKMAQAPAAAATEQAQTGEDRIIPNDELEEFNVFGTEKDEGATIVYDLMPSVEHPNSFVQAKILVKFDIGPKGKLLAEREKLVKVQTLAELRQACSIYFKSLTFEDVKSPDAIPKAQEHLKEVFNEIVNEGSKEKTVIIYKVIIENLLPQ
jgi:flagellar basal body-associated protein FliL